MKKQVLALTALLVFTSAAAFADSVGIPPSTPMLPGAGSILSPKRTGGHSLLPNIPSPESEKAFNQMRSKEEARKKVADKVARDKELMYAVLNLTPDQKTRAEALDAKTKANAVKYYRKVRTEAKRLNELKKRKASFFAIYKQKHILNAAKRDMKNYIISSNREFLSILDKDQKAKFKELQKAKRQEMKDYKNQYQNNQKHHKKSKQLKNNPQPAEIKTNQQTDN